MNKILNKKNFNKILILLLVVICFNFICPTVSLGADLGGNLMKPVANLLTSLGDGIVNVIHKFVLKQDITMIRSSNGKLILDAILSILAAVGVVVAGLFIATVVPIGGTAVIGTIVLAGVGTGVFVHSGLSSSSLALPVYSISPEDIFMGEIPLFNVNFFNPEDNDNSETKDVTGKNIFELDLVNEIARNVDTTRNLALDEIELVWYQDVDGKEFKVECYYDNRGELGPNPEVKWNIKDWHRVVIWGTVKDKWGNDRLDTIWSDGYDINSSEITEEDKNKFISNVTEKFMEYGLHEAGYIKQNAEQSGNTYVLKLESNKSRYNLVIRNYGKFNETRVLTTTTNIMNTAADLQETVAKWFVTLRNIALVLSMSILVYVGIRMMITSIASEKAKYKTMLVDWVIGVGLIFTMQYIMVFATFFNEELVNLITSMDIKPEYTAALYKYAEDGSENKNLSKIIEKYNETTGENISFNKEGYLDYKTNLMGNVRLLVQQNRDSSLSYVGYTIMFLVLVFYTVMFIFIYLKRVLYMAMLTILAPFVAMTYPIDKSTDGQAQAFNMWTKEYLINLLIQPMHLLLYYILISSAIDLATKNILYSLVAIGFLIPSEKIIRKFFGLDRAKTPGVLNGAAGAGIVMSAVGSLRRFANPGGPEKSKDQDTTGKIRTKSSDPSVKLDTKKMFGGNALDEKIASEERQAKQELIRQQGMASAKVNAARERLDELRAEGFEAGDKEFDEVQKEIAQYAGMARQAEEVQMAGREEVARVIQEVQNTPIEDTPEDDEKELDTPPPKKRTLLNKFGGAVGNVAVGGLRGAGRLTGKIPRLIARGYGAATLGAVGLAAGIATGDPNSVFKYTVAGAGAGSALGAGVFNRGESAVSNIADDAIRGWFGDEYDDFINTQADKKFMSSKQNHDEFRAEFGDKYKEKMAHALEYRKHGITDNTIIMRAMRLSNDFGGSDDNSDEKIYIAKLASKISTRNDLAKLRESLLRRGIPAHKVGKIVEGIETVKKFN